MTTPDQRPKVAQLVPSFCAPNADPASLGRLRSAFVAHTMFFHEAGSQSVQIDALLKAGVDDGVTIVRLLCESYSRAIFETLFGMHCDRMDAHADEQLRDAISDTFGPDIAAAVHEEVALRGVVIDKRL